MTTDFPSYQRTLGEIDAGGVESMASHALKDIVQSLVALDGTKTKGKLKIEMTIERARGSGQLLVSHLLAYTAPTADGKRSEESRGETLMYATAGGSLSVLPADQMALDLAPSAKREGVSS